MAVWRAEPDGGLGRMQAWVAAAFLAAGVVLSTLGEDAQQQLAGGVRATVLRPFLAVQEGVALARTRAGEMDRLRAELDSLAARLHSQASLAEENVTLRGLLDLAGRVGPAYRSATALRSGTAGSESMFLLDVGRRDGVVEGAPVVAAGGLVGAVRDVGVASSVAMDWTHPDFRASAMVVGLDVYGIIENRRGAFREDDRLVLDGVAFNETVADGSLVVTSGLGGVYPRGIPIGTVDGVAEAQGAWRKSYWLRPAVLPGEVTHVLVALEPDGAGHPDWPVADTTAAATDSASAVADSTAAGAAGPGTGAGQGG